MKPFKTISNLFKNSRDSDILSYEIKCAKCGEKIKIRINPKTDLSRVFEESAPESASYVLKKEALGNNCQNIMNITCYYDLSYGEISREISSGKFVDKDA